MIFFCMRRTCSANLEGKMTETKNDMNQEQANTTHSDLVGELSRLGENLGKLLKASWESDERKSVERELRNGLDQFGKQINQALEQAHADQNVKKARDTIKEAWETAHGPQVLTEMHLGLVDSLKKLNDELSRRAEPKPAHEVKADEAAQPPEEVKVD
jgi:hypothetical protein